MKTAKLDAVATKEPETIVCPECGEKFIDGGVWTIWCSNGHEKILLVDNGGA